MFKIFHEIQFEYVVVVSSPTHFVAEKKYAYVTTKIRHKVWEGNCRIKIKIKHR